MDLTGAKHYFGLLLNVWCIINYNKPYIIQKYYNILYGIMNSLRVSVGGIIWVTKLWRCIISRFTNLSDIVRLVSISVQQKMFPTHIHYSWSCWIIFYLTWRKTRVFKKPKFQVTSMISRNYKIKFAYYTT